MHCRLSVALLLGKFLPEVAMSRGRDMRDVDLACKIFVGGLDRYSDTSEVERAFKRYGPVQNVWVARNPPGFGFVVMEDRRDAEDAVRALDGTYVQ